MSRIMLRRLTLALPPLMFGTAVLVGGPATAAPTDPIQTAACDFGRQLTTYDYSSYDDYDQRVLDRSTGPFRDQFLKSSTTRRTQAQTGHDRSEALAVECHTDTADPAHARMVVTVDQTTTSDATFGIPRPSHTVYRIGLDNIGGRWLADQVDPVPTN